MLNLSSISTIVVAQTESSGNALGFLLPIAILGGLFYVLLVLPQRRRAKKAQELRNSIEIGDDVWIGARAVVLPGVVIGDGAVVGAGAVVTRSVPEGTTVAGNPARPLVPSASSE